MTNRTALFFSLLAATLILNGCSSSENNVFGEEKAAPDEFAVYSRAPLSLPPDFGLRPPKPGATRPQTVMPRNEAKEALLSNSVQTQPKPSPESQIDQTPGVRALLINAGAENADPNIRNIVNNETAALSGVGDENFADSILFWRKGDGGLRGAVIDPAVEERRMRQKQAQGDAIEEEAPSPTIQRRGGGESRPEDDKGFWGGLFD